jgi:hypothetical protein
LTNRQNKVLGIFEVSTGGIMLIPSGSLQADIKATTGIILPAKDTILFLMRG